MPLVSVAKASAASGRGARARNVDEPMAEIRRAFVRLVASVEIDDKLLEHFAAGAVFMDPLPWAADAFRREISAALRDMVQAAGDYELQVVDREGHLAVVEKKVQKLDTTDEQALAWIRQEAGALVEGMSQRKLRALRALIAQATERGETPQQLGRRIVRDKLAGLLERDIVATENLYRRLLREGRTRTRSAELVARYRRTLTARRAERIARTEMTRSWSAGQVAGWRQAQRDGLLNRDALVEWLNGGADPCPKCRALNGKRVKVGGVFYPGGYRYPGETHPNCECLLVLVVDASRRRRGRAA